ncbi:kelch-like protein 10 [Plectropomus leopardus]|uniref:kelch-like protein 10 n=1 Tax=Plectropomus leopardus TaxID=160734 RepID=UPI001C4DCEBF|nr:kelch-like protein 10 [Plectropomus leopardus]
MSVYNKLRLDQQLCDVVIRVDGVEFHAHKIVLCSSSPYFKALFTHWSTPDRKVFDIPNVSPDMMKLIIEFAYTGFVLVTPENLEELLQAADQFNVEGIVQTCCDFLEKQLTPQNCIGIWWFTDCCYTPQLRRKAFLFILIHFEEVVATSEEFLLLSGLDLAKILEEDQLNVRNEWTVLSAIQHWIAFADEERQEYTAMLFSRARLALVSPGDILSNVKNNNLLKTSICFRPILLWTLEATLDVSAKRFSDSILARPRLPPAILLAVGGWSNGNPISGIEAYDVRADCWVSVTNNEDGSSRAYHGTVFLDGSVYSVGGCDNNEFLSSVHRFDLSTRLWQMVAPMHSRRCFVSVTVMDGCIYAIGGNDGHLQLQTAERYQPRTNQWTLIAPMHERRANASCATLHGKVYICGGFNGYEYLSTVECYNPATNQWTLIGNMGERRSGAGVIAYAGRLMAVGGFNGTTHLHTAEVYNPDTNTWHAGPPMLNSRSNFGIAVIDEHLFVVGGFNSTFDVECYDVNTGKWSDVSDMEVSRTALGCCVVDGIPNLAEYAAPRHSL